MLMIISLTTSQNLRTKSKKMNKHFLRVCKIIISSQNCSKVFLKLQHAPSIIVMTNCICKVNKTICEYLDIRDTNVL